MLFKEEKGHDLNGDSFYPAYTPLGTNDAVAADE